MNEDFRSQYFSSITEMLSQYSFPDDLNQIIDSSGRCLNLSEVGYLFKALKLSCLIGPNVAFLNKSTNDSLFNITLKNSYNAENQNSIIHTVQCTILDYLFSITSSSYLDQMISFVFSRQMHFYYYSYQKLLFENLFLHSDKLRSHLIENQSSFLLQFLSILLEFGIKNNHQQKSGIVQILSNHWSNMYPSDQSSFDTNLDQLHDLIQLILKMVIIDPKICCNQSIIYFFCNILSSTTLHIKYKKKLLPTLVHFYNYASIHDNSSCPIVDNVKVFFNYNFPVLSRDLSADIHLNDCYIDAISSILQCLQIPCNIGIHLRMLRTVVIPIFCREASHPSDENLKKHLSQFFNRLLPNEKLELFIGFEDELTLLKDHNNIMCFLNKFYLLLVSLCDSKTLNDIFESRLILIKDRLVTDNIEEVKEEQLKCLLRDFEIIISVYKNLGPFENQEKIGLRDSKLISDLSKRCNLILNSKPKTLPNELTDLICDVKSRAYHCLSSVIIATQTEEKFYTNILLKSDRQLFQQIIPRDCMKTFINDNLLRKNKLITFYAFTKNESRSDVPSLLINDIFKTPIHVTSQFLSDSSLAFDVNKLEIMVARDIKIEVDERKNNVQGENFQLISLEVPDDPVNNHIAMEIFISLLYHLKYLGIISTKKISEIPNWMKIFYESFTRDESYIDIKYFISKLILNCNKIFEDYATFWIPKFIEFITITQKSINRYVVSMVTLINQWSRSPDVVNTVPESSTNTLVQFLAEHCYNENPALNQINCKLFQVLIERWSPKINVPYKQIFGNLNNSNNINDNRTCCGLQMLAFVLKSGNQFMAGANSETKIGFVKLLGKTLRNKYKNVYGICFELCGIILKQSSGDLTNTDPCIVQLEKEMQTSLDFIYRRSKSDYVSCLALISLNSTAFVWAQISTLICILNSLKDNDLCSALEVIGSCTCEKQDWVILFKKLYDLNIFENIQFKSSTVIRASIQLIHRTVSMISDWNSDTEIQDIIMKMFEHCFPCCKHEDKEVRTAFYQMFIQLASVQNDITSDATLCSTLLMGLMDVNPSLSQDVRNFCSYKILPKETFNRANQILNLLFPSVIALSSKTEILSRSKFLSIATNLILEMTSQSPDFTKSPFQNPLDTNISFEPLTATHISTQTSRSLLPNFVKANTSMTVISASQEHTFKIPTSTNIPKKTENFDWIKIASTLPTQREDIFENISDFDNSINLASTSMADEMFSSYQSQSSYLGTSIFKNDMDIDKVDKIYKTYAEATEQPEQTSERSADYFRQKAIEKQKSNEKKRIIERNLNKSAMFLYRNYHTGKLPYIQIQNCSLIASIQMLAQNHEDFSKDLFYHLFNGLIKEGSSILDQNLYKSHCTKITEHFNNIFSTCTVYDKALISCCLQIAIENISSISIAPMLIYTASNLTGNQALATILLEKYLIYYLDKSISFNSEEPPIKKKKLAETCMISTIVPILMKLYKFLQLNEEIIGLLHIEVVSVSDKFVKELIRALEVDYLGNYAYSYKIYNSLLSENQSLLNNEDESSFEFELLSVSENGLINSLEKLCKWNELSVFLDDLMKNSTHSQDHVVMKSLIHSKLRTSILGLTNYSESMMNDLPHLIETFDKHFPNSSELLIPMEMALYHIETGNYPKAEEVCDMGYKSVLTNYQKYTLTEETDLQMLQSLHLLYEMSEFLLTVKNPNNLRILDKWNNISVDTKYSLEFWEKLIFHRTVYLKKFKTLLPSFSEKIEENLFNFRLQFIDACIYHQRDVPALNNLRLCKPVSDQGNCDLKLMWDLKYSKVYLQSAGSHGNSILLDVDDIVKGINNSISLLSKVPNIDEISFTLKYLYFTNLGDCYWSLANICHRHWSSISNKSVRSLLKTVNLEATETADILYSELSKKSFIYLEKIIPLYNETLSESDRQQLSKSLMVLSDFCDSQFIENEDDICVLPEMIKSYAESTLYAMATGEFSAKNKFPRLLQVLDKNRFNAISVESIMTIVSSIPSWMFIPWLDQMIPYLISGNHYLVESIIFRIAHEYPHALFYTFQLQVSDVPVIQPPISRIQKKLSVLYLTNEFYNALLQLAQPENRLMNWLSDTSCVFRNQSSRMSLVDQYQELYRDLFSDEDVTTGSDKRSQFQREFTNKFRRIMVQNFKEDGTKLHDLNTKEFSNIEQQIHKEIKQWKAKIRNLKHLSYFSPWLSNYNIREIVPISDDANQNWLEVPGQYNNVTNRPFPERNIKIFKFDPTIQIIFSKQCPKKIKIIGDNEQCFSFLLKSGEDLRQDYRIEQLFNVMNYILSGDCQLMRNIRSSKHLVTYKVVPISKQIGLLEWIEHTVILKSFYFKTVTKEEQTVYGAIIDEYYSKFPDYNSYTESWNWPDFLERNRKFEAHQTLFSKWDLLRRSFMAISKNHESFYRLRIKFIQQYATMSAAHYVLGIGDRHLQNFLIDESSGNIIGIDFGYAFGMSIFLPIPELMPFRLTSTTIQFLRPAGVNGIFSQTLDNVLTTLGSKQSIIMSIMYVFLTNPIIDWQRMNKLTKQSIDGFTYKRINICQRKLMREDPHVLLYEELNLKHSKSKWFQKLKEFYLNRQLSSPTKQLVYMASNSAVLSRVFRGFEPFL